MCVNSSDKKMNFWSVLTLSADSDMELEIASNDLVALIRENPSHDISEIARSCHFRQTASRHRRMLVCRDPDDALAALETRDSNRVLTRKLVPAGRSVAFMFPGLGDHYVNMGLGIYQSEKIFRGHVDRCSEILEPLLGLDLREVMYPPGKDAGGETGDGQPDPFEHNSGVDLRKMLRPVEDRRDEASRSLNLIYHAHPALFVIEYALARLWIEWGIHPRAMIGYSIGEYVAACLAGVLSLEDSLYLVAKRAKLVHELSDGAMMAVSLPEKEVQPLLSGDLSVSAVNGPSFCVISGPPEGIGRLEQGLAERGVTFRRIQSSHAFHSKSMEPASGLLNKLVENVTLRPPKIPYISNVTGTWITKEQATSPEYFGEHLVKAVRFADGVRAVWGEGNDILLEVGPGNTLCSLALQSPGRQSGEGRVVLASIRHRFDRQPDMLFFLNTLGKLWLEGINVEWARLYPVEDGPNIPLSTGTYFAGSSEKKSGGPSRTHVLNGYAAPKNGVEQRIVGIWEKLLRVDRVGAYDNFFNLGGNSLLGTQHISRMREAFGVDLPLTALFESPTVAEQAMIVEELLIEKIENLTEEEAESMLGSGSLSLGKDGCHEG